MADGSYGGKAASSPDRYFRTDLQAGAGPGGADLHTPYNKDPDRAALLASLTPLATQTTLGAVDTKLASILSTLQAQQDIAVSLWTDNTNAYFVRRDVIDQDSGTVTVTWTNSTGTAATPGAGLRPVDNEESLQTVSSRFVATNTGTGYTTGDLLERAVVLDLNTAPATVVSSVWVNITTGAVIAAPTGGHYAAAPTGLPAGAATETTLAAASAKLPASLGSKADASSLSIALGTQSLAAINALLTATPLGNIAHGAADAGAPIKMGGKGYAGTPPAVDDLDRADQAMTLRGGSHVNFRRSDGTELDFDAPGQVVGVGDKNAPAITTTNGAYSANDVVGGKISFPTANRATGGAGWVHSMAAGLKANVTPNLRLFIFDADPTTSLADNAAWSMNVADLPKLVDVVDFTTAGWVSVHATGPKWLKKELRARYELGVTTLFAYLVTLDAVTLTSTADVLLMAQLVFD